jgi:hypothetical protein
MGGSFAVAAVNLRSAGVVFDGRKLPLHRGHCWQFCSLAAWGSTKFFRLDMTVPYQWRWTDAVTSTNWTNHGAALLGTTTNSS